MLLLQRQVPHCLHRLEGLQTREEPVGERLVREWPQMLGGLQFERIDGEGEQVDALGYLDGFPGVPAGAIEHEEKALPRPRPRLSGKGSKDLAEEQGGDGGEQPPHGLPRRGADKAADIEPLVALLHRGTGSLPSGCPHASNEWKQPDSRG